MRAAWIWPSGRESIARRLLLSPLVPFSWMVAAGAAIDRAVHTRGWRRVAKLSGKVVSVGNLGVGGTAKTPAAAWLARSLQRRGHRVALASRGTGRRVREKVLVVSDGRFVRSRAENAGDEPMLLSAQASGVPVVVARTRELAGLRALSAFGSELLVLDDGFHHHRLYRDVDLVMIDAAVGFGNGAVLPRGPLRERMSALRFADAVGIVDGPLSEDDDAALRRHAPDVLRFDAHRRPRALRSLAGGEEASPRCLANREVGMLAAIARPEGFRATLEDLGARVVAERCFRDHHRYRARDLVGLRRDAEIWVTTEKDAVKITPSWVRGVDVRTLLIDFDVEEPAVLLDWLEARLR